MDDFMDMGMDMGMDGEMMGKPPNPRFAGLGGDDMGMGMEMYDEEGNPLEFSGDDDEAILNWIYVDSDGKPLDSGVVAESPDTKFVHLIPFCLKGKVDQRKIDLLLRSFATMSVPIDVRQIRINPDAMSFMGDEGGMMDSMEPGAISEDGVRRYDMDVELRGSIALVQKPDGTVVGLDTGPQE